jgi:transposase
MTESEIKTVKSLWDSGVSLERIYRMLPYYRYDAYKQVKELRDKGVLKPRRDKTKRMVKAIAHAWQTETKDPNELAVMFGYAVSTINTYLQRSGVREGKRQPHNFNHCPKTNDIVDELREGAAICEIAKKFGVSRQYVFKVKKRLGLRVV